MGETRPTQWLPKLTLPQLCQTDPNTKLADTKTSRANGIASLRARYERHYKLRITIRPLANFDSEAVPLALILGRIF
ncbi:MAG: hypothetical protein KME21_24380 [Desmonostoc vinosum HA7617-LM4]|jgi:hypothetical protein|nr:hypothetical protein [Desmonostoc vinosum HA7617-LM4]